METCLPRIGVVAAACAAFLFQSAAAVPFTNIRIGDQDGFGFTPTIGLVRATPAPHTVAADTNGNGRLEQGEYLPDINKNGTTATGSGDAFDQRSAAEMAGGFVEGSGFSSAVGTVGSQWTDKSFAGSPAPVFQFRFVVPKTNLVSGTTMFFNLLFGDYDVFPATVDVTRNNGFGAAGGISSTSLTLQSGSADGLIQAAFISLSFGDVFSDGGPTNWVGFLDVKLVAPSEPFMAIDFAELGVKEIPFVPAPIPDSGTTLLLLGSALTIFARLRRGFVPH